MSKDVEEGLTYEVMEYDKLCVVGRNGEVCVDDTELG